MADDEFDPRDGERVRRVLRILGIALTVVLGLCVVVAVGFYVFLYVAMSSYASNK